MTDETNPVVADTILKANAFGWQSQNSALLNAIPIVSNAPASGSGIAVFYSGPGNAYKAEQCVANLDSSGPGGYWFPDTTAGDLANQLNSTIPGWTAQGWLLNIASAKMGAETNPSSGAIVFTDGNTSGVWYNYELPALVSAGVPINYYNDPSQCLPGRQPLPYGLPIANDNNSNDNKTSVDGQGSNWTPWVLGGAVVVVGGVAYLTGVGEAVTAVGLIGAALFGGTTGAAADTTAGQLGSVSGDTTIGKLNNGGTSDGSVFSTGAAPFNTYVPSPVTTVDEGALQSAAVVGQQQTAAQHAAAAAQQVQEAAAAAATQAQAWSNVLTALQAVEAEVAASFPDYVGSLGDGDGVIDDSSLFGNDFGDGSLTGESEVAPIVLDLSGKGINITPLTSSNTFVDLAGNGYENRTAWAGAGNAVLFFDPNNTNAITNSDQVIFTAWDSTATTDLQALEDVFDTNHDGSFDAGDAEFSEFKLMITNADGTTTVETLAQAGITSINLTGNKVSQTFTDGSSIDGETTFTTSSGTTGTVATVTFATDANGYAVQSTTTVNGDGSTIIDNKAFNADGSLANETISTISANGLSKTIDFDDTGNGIIDHVQTDDTVVNGDGSKTETLSDLNGADVLQDRLVTTTSADGKTISIARDLNGGGIVQQTEVRQTNSDGSITDTLTNVNEDGSMIKQMVTSSGAGGFTKTTQIDSAGDGIFDLTTVDAIVFNSDGSRTETLTNTNSDGSLRDRVVTTTSVSGQMKVIQRDSTGDGIFDLTTTSRTVNNSDGSATTTVTVRNSDGSLRDQSITTISADGLSTTVQTDLTGDGVFDTRSSDVTVDNSDGSQTETVAVTSASGNLLSQTVTQRSANGVSRTVDTDANGDGTLTATEVVTVASDGTTTDTVTNLNADGSMIDQTVKTTSVNGLSKTTRVDSTGDGTFDLTTTDAKVLNTNGSSTETVTDRNANGSMRDQTVRTTSANGLSITTQVDITGDGTFDRTMSDVTVVNSDGSQTETVSTTSANGTKLSQVVTNISANKLSATITTDANGDGAPTSTETIVTAANGVITDTLSDLNPDGSLRAQTVTTTSANDLSKTTQIDSTGNGTFDVTRTDVIVINANGSRTETVTDKNAGGSMRDQTVTTTSANGLSQKIQADSTGDGTFETTTTEVMVINADGSQTETDTDFNANGLERDQAVTTTSADGLSIVTTRDLNSDGAIDLTTADTIVLHPDGSRTETIRETNTDGLFYSTTITTSADGKTVAVDRQFNGSVTYRESETSVTQANGAVVDTLSTFDAAGMLLTTQGTTTSASGLSKTVQTDVNGDGAFDIVVSDLKTLNADGSSTETMSKSGSAGLIGETVTTTSADGLSITTETDTTGNGTFDVKTTSVTALNADGSTTETVTEQNADGSTRETQVTTTNADKKDVTIRTNLEADGSQTETIDEQSSGSIIDTLSGFNANGSLIGEVVTTTSANGLSKDLQYFSVVNGSLVLEDTQNTTAVLNSNGSVTETFSASEANGATSTVVTTTSADGLSVRTNATIDGNVPISSTDLTVLNSDGSRTETVAAQVGAFAGIGAFGDESVRSTSEDGLTTSFVLEDDGTGQADVSSSIIEATDGSEIESLQVRNSATGIQQSDTITESADGRTFTLQGMFDDDGASSVSETVGLNANGTITDTSAASNGPQAFGFSQVRTQQFNTDGGQTIAISDSDGEGVLQDRTATTVSGNGLSSTSTTTFANGGSETLSDVTVVNANGSRTETILETASGGAILQNASTQFEKIITTSADGRDVETETFDGINGGGTEIDNTSIGADGSETTTTTFLNPQTGQAIPVFSPDGGESASVVTTISADGLVGKESFGDYTLTTTMLADENGSYQWQETTASGVVAASGWHIVDANGIDSWTSNTSSATTTIKIDVASENIAIGQAAGIYYTILGRAMLPTEQQNLVQFIQGGALNQAQLANSLLSANGFAGVTGTATVNALIESFYQNAFGEAGPANEEAQYVTDVVNGVMSLGQVAADIAETADAELAGDGLLQGLTASSAGTPTTVAQIPTATQDIIDAGAAFEQLTGEAIGSLPQSASAVASATPLNIFSGLFGGATPVIDPFVPVLSPEIAIVTRTPPTRVVVDIISNANLEDIAPASEVVDIQGSGNTITMVGSGQVLATVGSPNTVLVASNLNEVEIAGSNDSIGISNNDAVLVGGSGNTISVNTGSGLEVNGSGNRISLSADDTLVLTDSSTGNAISVASDDTVIVGVGGTGDVISVASGASATVDSDSNQITLASNDTVTLNGSGNAISLGSGDNATVNGSSNAINETSGATAFVFGNGNSATLNSGAFLGLNGSSETVTATGATILVGSAVLLSSGSSATINGSGNLITASEDTTLVVSGSSDTATLASGDSIQVSGTNDTVNASDVSVQVDASGSTVTLNGGNDVINEVAGATLVVSGDGDFATLAGGDSIEVSGKIDTVNASDASVQVEGGGSMVTLSGANDSVDVAAAATLVVFGSGNSATLADGATIELNGTNETVDSTSDTIKVGASSTVTIVNGGAGSTGPSGTLELGVGTAPDDLWFARSGNDLVVEIFGSSGQITIRDWFTNSAAQLQTIVAGDGSTIGTAAISTLESAMAAYQSSNPNSMPVALTQTVSDSWSAPSGPPGDGGDSGEVTIDAQGSTSLIESSSDYFLVSAVDGSSAELSFNGSPATTKTLAPWTPVAAEAASGGGYYVAMKNANANLVEIWDVNSSGDYVSTVADGAPNNPAIESYETIFQQDLNGDGIIGVSDGEIVEDSGNTRVSEFNSNYYLLPVGGGEAPELYFNGAAVTPTTVPGWTLLGAEAVSGGYDVAWSNAAANLIDVWSVDTSGKYVSTTVNAAPNSATVESYETLFQQDLNGDGVIGLTASETVEAEGNTSVANFNSNYFLLPVGGGGGPELHFNGAAVTPTSIPGWTLLGAEAVSGGYDVAWSNAAANLIDIWSVDTGGNYVSTIVNAAPSSATVESYETLFQQDLNGDGTIESPEIVEADGSTITVQIGANYFLNPIGGTGPELYFNGAAVTPTSIPGWTLLGAEAVSGGYDVAWSNAAANLIDIWTVDASGNYVSTIVNAAPSSATVESYETLFQQDLNGDGTIERPEIVEADGSTSTVQIGSNYFLNPIGGGTGPELYFNGAAVTPTSVPGWTLLGAEAVSGGYDVAWSNAGANLVDIWTVDASGKYVSTIVGAAPNSAIVESYEPLFQQDLNGDGTIGFLASQSLLVAAGDAVKTGAVVGDTGISESGSEPFAVVGSGGNDIYQFKLGDGHEVITAGASGETASSSELQMGQDVSSQKLWFVQSGSDLNIDVLGSKDSVTVQGWFSSTGNQLSDITAGGLKIDSQISQLVQAMATYSANNPAVDPAVVAQMPDSPALQSTIASAWHG